MAGWLKQGSMAPMTNRAQVCPPCIPSSAFDYPREILFRQIQIQLNCKDLTIETDNFVFEVKVVLGLESTGSDGQGT